MAKKNFHKVIIGRSETVSFVDFNIDVPAKVDTGAYRSAIHADKISLDKNGILHFRILGGHPACNDEISQEITTDKYNEVKVANSFGHSEKRYEVKLRIKIGARVVNSPFSLANRANNVYPILLGRKLLNGRFVVDSEFSSINRAKLKKDYKINLLKDEEEGR